MDDRIDLEGKRVTVMGLGRFGGGVGAVRFLDVCGAKITLTDQLSERDLQDSLEQLNGVKLAALHLGGHCEQDFSDADLILVNPGVPPHNRYLQLARDRNIPLASEISLFWRFNRGRTVGVTGSNGKSTTAALLHGMLEAAGLNSWLGGNIGRSLLPVVDEIEPDDWVVLELSSFQLDDLDRMPTSPDVAVVTNFSPNHLDWHGSLDEYRRAKQSILRWQTPDSTAILNYDDSDVADWKTYGQRLWFGSNNCDQPGVFPESDQFLFRDGNKQHRLNLADWLPLPGEHNLQNAAAAACAALSMGVPVSAIQQGLESFTPLPHRLQKVGTVCGRTFYNDSLATTPDSVVAALAAFSEPVVLLAGGYDKQVDLRPMAEAIVERGKAVALMGQTADVLADLIEQKCDQFPQDEFDSIEGAFAWACGNSEPGDVVLLSPGCASYDWFRNFQERGERFMALVEQWPGDENE